MGTFSDVAFAIKGEAFEALSDKSKSFLKEYADDTFTLEGDKLFIFSEIKWYTASDGPIKDFIEELDGFAVGAFKLIEACHSYPSSDDERGSWDDNPWEIRANVSVELHYRELGDLEQTTIDKA